MFRKDPLDLLAGPPRSLTEVARELQVDRAEIQRDLERLARSLKRTGRRLVVQPAECRKCGFLFSNRTFARPGKCPEYRATWIAEPLVRISAG